MGLGTEVQLFKQCLRRFMQWFTDGELTFTADYCRQDLLHEGLLLKSLVHQQVYTQKVFQLGSEFTTESVILSWS